MISGPSVSVPTGTQTHRPGWAGVQPAAGAQRAHSAAAGLWGRRARQVWGCGAGARGSTEGPKCPLLVGRRGCRPGGRSRRWASWPHPTQEMQSVHQLTKADGETEAQRGWWAAGHARPRALARQGRRRCGRLLVWAGKGGAAGRGPRAEGQGCSRGLGGGLGLGGSGDGGPGDTQGTGRPCAPAGAPQAEPGP